MLSSFGDGQFGFSLNLDDKLNLPRNHQDAASAAPDPATAVAGFSPFGFAPFGLLPTESIVSSPYVGSFDPFGDAEQVDGGESGGKKSRFDFARKRGASNFGIGGSPSSSPVGDMVRGLPDVSRYGMDDFASRQQEGRSRYPAGISTPSNEASNPLWGGNSDFLRDRSMTASPALPPPGMTRAPPPGLATSSNAPSHLARQVSTGSPGFAPPPGLSTLTRQQPPHQQQQQPPQQQQQQPYPQQTSQQHAQTGGANWLHQLSQQQSQQPVNDPSRMAFQRQQPSQGQYATSSASDRASQAQALKEMLGVGMGMNLGVGAMSLGMNMGSNGSFMSPFLPELGYWSLVQHVLTSLF